MRAAIIGFALGTLWLQWQPSLPDHFMLFLALVAAVLAFVFARMQKQSWRATSLRLAVGALSGAVWAALFALYALKHELPKEWEGRDVTLIGTVASLPQRSERGVRFQFAVERAMDEASDVDVIPPKLLLSWLADRSGDMAPQVKPGERWQLTVRLKRPRGNANPHGFDYEAWLLGQGVRATGYVRSGGDIAHNRRLDSFVFGPGSAVDRARAWLRDRMERALAEKPYAGVIVALVIGDQRAIRQSDWAVFNRTGVSHLMSISGLHVTMLVGMAAAIMAFLWRRSFFTRAQLPLILPAQKAAAVAGAAMAFLYVFLAGFGVPAQRTLYMLSVVALALWFDRLTSVSHVLLAALGLVLLLDPWAVLWPGFWLSFGAVAAILYASTGRVLLPAQTAMPRSRPWRETLLGAARTQYAVTVGLVPLTLLLFGQVLLISPLANAVAIPLVSLIVTPMALFGSILPDPLLSWVLGVAHFLVEGLATLLGWLGQYSFATWSAPVPPPWLFAFALIGTLWMLAPRGWPARWLGMVCWLPLLFAMPTRPAPGEMWVTAFDVGQGSALLVETHDHRLLYDTGPAYSPEADGGNRVILPYLRGRGINQLDAMVISHNDSDHAGGAASVAKEIRIGQNVSSLPISEANAMSAARIVRCQAGQAWEWDGVHFAFLHPPLASYDSTKWKSNDLSCVLKVTARDKSILLTGDIGWVQEDELVNSPEAKLRSTVLVAPHHGGAKTSTQPFIEAVMPEMVLFQAGYRNRYQHPRPEILERYEKMGIRVVRTDQSGAVSMRFGAALETAEYRKTAARYWSAP